MSTRHRLLVIDDDDAQVRLLTRVVGKSFADQLDMTAMTDAQEASRWIEACCPDLVVTDLEMPGASGLEILRTAKRRNPAAQVLLLTGCSSTQSLLDALESGATDYLLKPLVAGDLIKLLRQSIERIERWQLALTDTMRTKKDRVAAAASE
ncbi:MAG: response regulator [Pirellulales bacterium]